MSCPHSEDQWASYFHHQSTYPQSSLNTYDSNMMTTDSVITTSSGDVVTSPTHSAPSTASQKPIRRRSRASKKTPTTLLNADASNFRALVQQFTGRPSSSSVITPGVQRGPVNINFGQGGYGGDDHQEFVSGSSFAPYDHSHGSGTNPHQQHLQYDYSYGNNPTNRNVEISDNFVGDGMQNIDDLDWGTISSATTHGYDTHHFM